MNIFLNVFFLVPPAVGNLYHWVKWWGKQRQPHRRDEKIDNWGKIVGLTFHIWYIFELLMLSNYKPMRKNILYGGCLIVWNRPEGANYYNVSLTQRITFKMTRPEVGSLFYVTLYLITLRNRIIRWIFFLSLDFLVFAISQPDSETVCSTDTFGVEGANNNPQVPVICGDNDGQHSNSQTNLVWH